VFSFLISGWWYLLYAMANNLKDVKIGFIGGGNMAFAIGAGLVDKKLIGSDQIIVSGPNINNLKRWKDVGVSQLTTSNYEVTKVVLVLVIGLKALDFRSSRGPKLHFCVSNQMC
jgi:hypothetical protein